ncbi:MULTISPECIES: hypothetical protein [unclassified Thioalkalivibrio]|uniref:hypothetical protein n=1 Tax=unclassified Thioalkalivibrio TaxID=2621013 RepID=UPI0003730E90|nr:MULTISPECIES: hypothetical protein [unclassified Thioalkalivibrio]
MQPTQPNTRTRATLLTGLAAGAALTLTGGQAVAGEVVMSGTIDGDERTWERFDTDDGGPAFFTDLPGGARLFNLHGLRDGSTPNPMGSLIVSVTTFNDNVGRVEVSYYHEQAGGPDFVGNDQLENVEYEFDRLEVDGDTARISGRVSGELHHRENPLSEETDPSRTRSVEVEFDTTLPEQE